MFVAGKYKTLGEMCVSIVDFPRLTCMFVAGKYKTPGEMFVSIIEFQS